ncbi:serine/threonine-protein kinase par-1-like [Phocoena sinus]|uniref:serine/threonine-protein kinase par-1-like n=1 Tax=Phocoena sinus TaxID=42100 RepID=UPI0013C516E3|nr:serine/threonine-protein kinase par-1-like [Phocoena sinus]
MQTASPGLGSARVTSADNQQSLWSVPHKPKWSRCVTGSPASRHRLQKPSRGDPRVRSPGFPQGRLAELPPPAPKPGPNPVYLRSRGGRSPGSALAPAADRSGRGHAASPPPPHQPTVARRAAARPRPQAISALTGRRCPLALSTRSPEPQRVRVRKLRLALGPAPGRPVTATPDCWAPVGQPCRPQGVRPATAQAQDAAPFPLCRVLVRHLHRDDPGTQTPPHIPGEASATPARRVSAPKAGPLTSTYLSRPCGELDGPNPFRSALTSGRSDQTFMDQRAFMEQVCECRDNSYLPSSKKISSGAFSKVYLVYATQERTQHNSKLASDLRGTGHPPPPQVAIKIVSTAEASVEFSCKFLPREISSLSATYKHLNYVQLYETYRNSWRAYLVLEPAARGDLPEHTNAVSDDCRCPGLEQGAHRLFRQLVSAVAHCPNSGIPCRDLKHENILLDDRGFLKLSDFGFANRQGLKNSRLSTFCGSVAYTALAVLTRKYSGEQADPWSRGAGVILYAMVTGKLPFKERQPHRMLYLMRRGPTLRLGLSPECQDLIRGLRQLRPRARLGLQQVAAQHGRLPAAHALFRTVLSGITPGAACPPVWAGGWLLSAPPDPPTPVSCKEA